MSTSVRDAMVAAVQGALTRQPQAVEALAARAGTWMPGTQVLTQAALDWLERAGVAERAGDGWRQRAEGPVVVPADTLRAVRELLGQAWRARRSGRGWRQSPVDPHDALSVVPGLSRRPGWRLVGWVHRDGDDGEGVVWAVPDDLDLPPPQRMPTVDRGGWAAPRPEGAQPATRALVPDGSPLSYALLVIVAQELATFGAAGGGLRGAFAELLDGPPWALQAAWPNPSPADAWSWAAGAAPTSWAPTVNIGPSVVTVTSTWWDPHLDERCERRVARLRRDGTLTDQRAEVLGHAPGGVVV